MDLKSLRRLSDRNVVDPNPKPGMPGKVIVKVYQLPKGNLIGVDEERSRYYDIDDESWKPEEEIDWHDL